MKVSPTFYNDAGELMAPRPLDVKLCHNYPGGVPTVDAGYYHLFRFQAVTRSEYDAKVRRFFTMMVAVPGYMTLTPREYEVRIGNFIRYGLEVLYVVESPDGVVEVQPPYMIYPHRTS